MEKTVNKGGKPHAPAANALEEAVTRVTRIEGRLDSLEAVTKELHSRIRMDEEDRMNIANRLDAVDHGFNNLDAIVVRLKAQMGYSEEDEFTPFKDELEQLTAIVDELRTKVEGRNKSAAVKRNMTDADAKAVMTGEWKELGHKAAGEKAGLTYAQVYSCRLEFTFKHVHKELREEGWVNPWAK